MVRRMRAVLPPVFLALSGSAFVPKLFACWNAQFFPPWWKAVALVCLALAILNPPFSMWVLLHHMTRVWPACSARRIWKYRDCLPQMTTRPPTFSNAVDIA